MAHRPLHPRHRIDIEPAALARALRACAHAPDDAPHALESWVCARGEVMATLSVRTAFDLLLRALELRAGDEVVLSGFTIPDMARVVEAQGAVAVPLDCGVETLCPTPEALDAALTPATRVVVIAQLFGARVDMAPFAQVCRARGVLLVDDDAQGFTGRARLDGSPDADVVFHSFGSIKTATALGGALVRVRDEALRARMRRLHDALPVQPPARYARKVATYLGLAALRDPTRYGRFAQMLSVAGRDLDAVIMQATRGFPAETPAALTHALRWRPCAALCATLHHALATHDEARVARRAAAGERVRQRLDGACAVLGDAMHARTHWLFAVLVDGADALVRTLRAEGFDAARGTSSIAALPWPRARREAPVQAMATWASHIVFLPVYPEMPDAERDRLADCVRRAAR